MRLEKKLNGLGLLRPWGMPRGVGKICLIIMKDAIPLLGDYLGAHPWLEIARVMLPDYESGMPRNIVFGESDAIPVGGLEDIGRLPQYEKLFAFPPLWVLNQLCPRLAAIGIDHLWLDGEWPPPFGIRTPYTAFFAENAPQLEKVYNMLETDSDRNTYARRIKAIMTGNAGYLPVSRHREYMHPIVRPAAGDIMIDGGVSDMVEANAGFAEMVGENGEVHGFEPIPWMAEAAARELARFPQYKLHCAGLADKSGEAVFDSLHDSSHISSSTEEKEGTIRCRLETIDDFCRNFTRVDCIKLDIEGAELGALHGARQIILKFAPKLVICLYHKPEDMFTIPLYIRSLNSAYRLHVAHSSCGFTDTILYAWVPKSRRDA